jgi:TfoX/Sxy family transcriptional regulator of competence genes
MPHDPHLADRMRAALKSRVGITERRMFGGYCWMLRGNMLCGVEVGRFMFRVGKALEADALARRCLPSKADDPKRIRGQFHAQTHTDLL